MEQVHACLLGEWVNLHDDENCKMGPRMTSPSIWWEETLNYGLQSKIRS